MQRHAVPFAYGSIFNNATMPGLKTCPVKGHLPVRVPSDRKNEDDVFQRFYFSLGHRKTILLREGPRSKVWVESDQVHETYTTPTLPSHVFEESLKFYHCASYLLPGSTTVTCGSIAPLVGAVLLLTLQVGSTAY